jgi:hypothetical protein
MIDRRHFYPHLISLLLVSLVSIAWRVHAADKLVGLHSGSSHVPVDAVDRAGSGSLKKSDLDFQLIFISSSGVATAATLGGDAAIALTGGIGNVRAYV